MSVTPAVQHALNEVARAADVLAEAAADLGSTVRQLRALLAQADAQADVQADVLASPDACVEAAAEAWGVTKPGLVSAHRAPTLVSAREGAALLAHRRGWSPQVIGTAIGKDRTTVISALKRARARLETDRTFTARVGRAEVLLAIGSPLAGLHAGPVGTGGTGAPEPGVQP